MSTGYPSIDKPWMKYYDAGKLNQTFPKMSIYEYLLAHTSDCDEDVAMTYFGQSITYAEFHQHIEEAAKALVKLGLKPGNRVMYLLPNIPETAYLLYGGAKIGAVADYIDPRPDSVNFAISAKKVLAMYQKEKVDFIVSIDQCYFAMLAPIEKELTAIGVKKIIIVSASDSMTEKAKINYLAEIEKFNGTKALSQALAKTKQLSDLVIQAIKTSAIRLVKYPDLLAQSKDVDIPTVPYIDGSLAVIVHTSGTSSPKPKPIPLTHNNMNFYVHQTYSANMPMSRGDKALQMLPYFAAYGLVNVVHALFCHKNNLIQIPEFLPANFGKLIAKHKPQTVIGAPSWFIPLPSDPALQGKDLSHLKMLTYGGDAMEPADEEKINAFLRNHNCKAILTKGHGMSETCGCASFATGEYNVLGSMGIPMPYTTYAVVDPETKEMLHFADGQEYLEGELIISSNAVTSGILDGKEIVPHRVYDGESFIFTRDVARMNRDGIMTFLSRNDRSFTRFDGYKIKPYEIEGVIKSFPGVQYCVVSPLYDSDKCGNVAVANIVLEEDIWERKEQVTFVEKLVDKLFTNNENVSTRQIPAWFRFKSQLPLTANSKIKYTALTEEKLLGTEISVSMDESNVSVESISIK